MTYLRNIGYVIGLIAALNGLLVIIFDADTPIGGFYQKIWYSTLLGHAARPNVKDPFASGEMFYIDFDPGSTSIDIDKQRIAEVIDRELFYAAERGTRNDDFPTSIIIFIEDLELARHEVRRIHASLPTIEIPDGATVSLGSSDIGKASSLEQFCSQYRTFEPVRLCFD